MLAGQPKSLIGEFKVYFHWIGKWKGDRTELKIEAQKGRMEVLGCEWTWKSCKYLIHFISELHSTLNSNE